MFKIGNVEFKKDKTVIIAEAGVNHNGNIDYGKRLIDEAFNAGADIIKFQTYKAEKLTTKKAPRFWNWEGEEKKDGTQFDSYSNLDSFGVKEHKILFEYCNRVGIEFMSTPFDIESADMLIGLGMKGIKIASCDLTNLPFIDYLASKNLPILLSTGAANIEEIQQAVRVIENQNNHEILIMHCTLCYPTKPEDSNLNAINNIKDIFPNYLLGLSDHSLGTIIPSASVLYGVNAIEKHFTFDKTLPDSADHWLSVDPNELKEIVDNVKTLNISIGNYEKQALECETETRKFARRSIVINKKMNKGATINSDDITLKRPGTGIEPKYYKEIIGKKVNKDLDDDHLLTFNDLE